VVEQRVRLPVLPDAWSSGLVDHARRRTPNAGELLRAKAPRIVGHLQALHGVMHALPLTYNKDLQEDKEHLFDSVDTAAPLPRRRDRDDRRRASTASACAPRRATS